MLSANQNAETFVCLLLTQLIQPKGVLPSVFQKLCLHLLVHKINPEMNCSLEFLRDLIWENKMYTLKKSTTYF